MVNRDQGAESFVFRPLFCDIAIVLFGVQPEKIKWGRDQGAR